MNFTLMLLSHKEKAVTSLLRERQPYYVSGEPNTFEVEKNEKTIHW